MGARPLLDLTFTKGAEIKAEKTCSKESRDRTHSSENKEATPLKIFYNVDIRKGS